MPKNSGSCQKLCNLILLVELLRLRRPDLRPVEPESLISLVGVPRRKPNRSDAKPAVMLLREQIAMLPAKERPVDQLSLFMDALEELISDPVPPPESFDPREGPTMSGLREETSARVQEALNRKGLIAVPLPKKEGTRGPLVPLNKLIPGIGVFFKDPNTAEAACRFLGNFFVASLIRPNTPLKVRIAAGAAAFGCAIGISRGT